MDLIVQALTLHNGNLRRVADELGISRPTLYLLLRKYGIRIPEKENKERDKEKD